MSVKRYELVGVNGPNSYTSTCGKCQMMEFQPLDLGSYPNTYQYVLASEHEAAIATLSAERDGLRRLLIRYGTHASGCRQSLNHTSPCECGFKLVIDCARAALNIPSQIKGSEKRFIAHVAEYQTQPDKGKVAGESPAVCARLEG